MGNLKDSFGARTPFDMGNGKAFLYRLEQLEKQGLGSISRLPFSIKIMIASLNQV